MATMNISVPDPMKDWVLSQVQSGTYANSSDYIRDLIRKDQENRTKLNALQQAITEG
ncbi:MAG: type II toxin-antitoxin system ParD family antitoxin, partial [Methylomicrobium sp.]|nr:type II toxin-antitoxin system ParD family antitoxin [Methylomicrobium sp.]